jgi:protein phosphatase
MTDGSRIDQYTEMYGEFTKSMKCDVSQVATGKSTFIIPAFDPDAIISLCRDVRDLFAREPTVLSVNSPVTIVGDLHGQILDLYRVVQVHGSPHLTRYLFLGDFVDRGDFSFEVVTYAFLIKILFPENVFIIRGNHEFESVCDTGGFFYELDHLFHDEMVFFAFIAAFSQIPLAAVLDLNCFAVHGGIGPDVESIQQLRDIKRPITEFDDSVLDSILWSDPSDEIDMFQKSMRGTGYEFGATAFKRFITQNAIRMVVRGHECVGEGCRETFDGRLMTVFSASNYCGTVGNQAAVAVKRRTGEFTIHRYPPLPRFQRQEPPKAPADLASGRDRKRRASVTIKKPRKKGTRNAKTPRSPP